MYSIRRQSVPSTVEQLAPSRVKLTVEIPFADLKPALDKAYKQIAEQVSIPGFRKGKVPAAVIDQRFGRGVVLQEAINDHLPKAYNDAVQEHEISPLGQPDIEVTKLADNDLVEFTAELDVRPAFDLPDLSTIKAEVSNAEVGENEVEERLQMLRENFASTNVVERAARQGDVVVIDLEGRRDGELLEDATATGVSYKIGSGGMLDGLDEAVTGLSAGEDATFTSTLVGGANKGEEADIKVSVTQVMEQELPEVDDEFAQLISEFDTVEEMRADLTKAVENQARMGQLADARDKVLEEVIKVTEFELPENLVKAEIEARREQVAQQLAAAGLTVEQYLEEAVDEEAKDADEFWATIEKRSTDALRAQIVLDKMADDDEIGVGRSGQGTVDARQRIHPMRQQAQLGRRRCVRPGGRDEQHCGHVGPLHRLGTQPV